MATTPVLSHLKSTSQYLTLRCVDVCVLLHRDAVATNDEQYASNLLVSDCILVFAGRFPAQEARHV